MLNSDCCLLYDEYFNSERISFLLQSRFKRNSNRTSFLFKSYLLEQSLNNIKLPHSLLKTYPNIIKAAENDEEWSLSESSDDEIEEVSSGNSPMNITDDDYLDKLAQWKPNESSTPSIESDEEEEMIEDNIHIDPVDSPTEMSSPEVEDLLITFVQYPVKIEPVINVNIPQLDGQNDFLQNKIKKSKYLSMSSTNRNKKKKNSNQKKSYTLQQLTSSSTEKSVLKHMILPEQKLDSHRKITIDNFYATEQKYIPTFSKSTDISIKKRKQYSPSKSRKLSPMVSNGKTILDYFQVIKRPSIKSSINKTKTRSENYFDGCIVIDDNDMQEIEEQHYTYSSDIHAREKLLDYAIYSSGMRIKWLLNVESILLEHISIYRQEIIRSIDTSLSYHIDSKLISIIILNFLKMFLIRTCDSEEDEFAFYQFSITLYLRYLLIELPTYKHENLNNEYNCSECKDYSLLLNILFDLLFDLIDYDICENSSKEKYRSSLIEDDYFHQLKLMKKNPFHRIKLLSYFIELIQIHRNKCHNQKEDFFLRINQWIENIIQQIIFNFNHEKLSICFNIIELCLLFIHEKEKYIKQMSIFLAKLCIENSNYIRSILFNENLLPDIRLLVINELVSEKFNIKFQSIDYLEEFFQQIQNLFKSANSIDDVTLLIVRSLFNTYADLIIDLKKSMLIYSTYSEQIISIFRNRLESIHLILSNLSHDTNSFREIQRTEIFFRLLKYKWNRL